MDSPDQPATVGFLLKEHRQRAGLSLHEIAKRTCIRRAYLEALEADRFDLLPGEIYVLGFLRNYADTIGLEAAPLIAQIRGQKLPGLIREDEPAGKEKSGMPAVLCWALLALIIVGVAGGLLYREWHTGPAGEKVPAVAAQEEVRTVAESAPSVPVGLVPAADPGDRPSAESTSAVEGQ
jgi:cytoskeleton protein RodZ